MAITPMALPSPKAYDPNQMEVTNLSLFKDPYTVDRASLQADLFRSDRDAAGEQYQHAVQGQQDYYNRALQAQANESMVEAIPKFLAQPHGIGIMQGVPEIRRILENMAPGLYDQYINQSFQGEKSKALQAGGAGTYSLAQAGLQVPPSEFLSATGVGTRPMTPLGVQIAGINAASSGGGGDGGGLGASIQLAPVDAGNGTKGTPTITIPKKAPPNFDWRTAARDRGLIVDTPTTALPYNPNAPAGQKQPSPPPTQAVKPTGAAAPAGAPVNREAAWDVKRKTAPPELKPVVDAIERARAQNGGKLVIDAKGQVIGVTPEGRREPLGRIQ